MFHSSQTFPCPETNPAARTSSSVVTEKGQQAKQAPLTIGVLQHKLNKVGLFG
jgi:hypothetical protein